MCSGVCGAAVIWLASFVDVDATPSNEVMTPVAAEMRQHALSFLASTVGCAAFVRPEIF